MGRRNRLLRTGALSLLLLTPMAARQAAGSPTVLTLDPAQSHVDVTLCVTLGSTVCDTDGSAVAGFVVLDLDCLTMPGAVSVHDFDLQLTDSIDLNLDFGFIIGRLDSSTANMAVAYAAPGTPRPAVPIAAGAFTDPQVPIDARGTLTYAATGGIPPFDICTLLTASGVPCNDVIDLSLVPLNPTDLAGTVAVSGRDITLTLDVQVTVPLDPANPSLGTLSMVGSVVATGTTPLPDIATFVAVLTGSIIAPDLICESDINQDGATDGRDIRAYLEAIL